MSQVGQATPGVAGTVSRARSGPAMARPDFVRRHPASLDPAPHGRDRAPGRPQAPQLLTAGLVLLAAAAVLEGYRWLQVIPSNRLDLPAVVFAVLVAPTTLVLTRPPHHWTWTPAQKVALAAVAGLVAVTVVALLVTRLWSAQLLGAYYLATALAIVVAALSGAGATSGQP